ncbi:Uncharacterised protein [Bordetella pertussis]|nr:Uncharacterised protein [Bordetella pertussis]
MHHVIGIESHGDGIGVLEREHQNRHKHEQSQGPDQVAHDACSKEFKTSNCKRKRRHCRGRRHMRRPSFSPRRGAGPKKQSPLNKQGALPVEHQPRGTPYAAHQCMACISMTDCSGSDDPLDESSP